MNNSVTQTIEERLVRITAGPVRLAGDLNLPEGSRAVVLFAHGSGSSRRSSRNRYVARLLNEAKLATLLIDLLTPDEDAIDERTAQLRFNIDLLAERLVDATVSSRIQQNMGETADSSKCYRRFGLKKLPSSF